MHCKWQVQRLIRCLSAERWMYFCAGSAAGHLCSHHTNTLVHALVMQEAELKKVVCAGRRRA
eukprot:1159781-Pelagomonas_calceolata.AAC.2